VPVIWLVVPGVLAVIGLLVVIGLSLRGERREPDGRAR